MREILQKDNPILRQVAREVSVEEISSDYIQTTIREMKESMHGQHDSAAIAAPQIGESVRIFIISKVILPGYDENPDLEDLVFINPAITKWSKKKSWVEEGCLSVRWLYGEVERHDKVTVTAFDENGKKVMYGASGVIAQAFQHEIDHLDGILFIDRAKNIREALPEEEH